jgi:hypothetical protein
MAQQYGLGRGLASLIPPKKQSEEQDAHRLLMRLRTESQFVCCRTYAQASCIAYTSRPQAGSGTDLDPAARTDPGRCLSDDSSGAEER